MFRVLQCATKYMVQHSTLLLFHTGSRQKGVYLVASWCSRVPPDLVSPWPMPSSSPPHPSQLVTGWSRVLFYCSFFVFTLFPFQSFFFPSRARLFELRIRL
ncbi:unnamed protein product [Discosporangium mesarthrocarpum]